jgi:uncharacterized protein (UPF0335 family)
MQRGCTNLLLKGLNMQNQNGAPSTLQSKEAIARLVKLYTQEQSLGEEIKEVKDTCKAAGFDPSVLSAVAKAIVKDGVDKLVEKSELTLEAVLVARS